MEWKTTWNDPLTSYLAPYHDLIGDKRTRTTFDETIRGIMGAGSLICQQIAVHSPVLATAKKGAQRIIRLASGESTQRSELDAVHLTKQLREAAVEHLGQAPEEEPQSTPGIVLPHLPDGAMELDEDAFVKMADGELQPFRRGDRLAVEVERSRKDFHRLDGILPDLLKHYVGVWYFCRPKAADAVLKTRERLVKEGTLSVAQSKLIRVLNLAEAEE